MCTYRVICPSGNHVLGSGLDPDKEIAKQKAAAAAHQMAQQVCGPGTYTPQYYQCLEIPVPVGRVVPPTDIASNTFTAAASKVIRPPLYECTATCHCRDGRKIVVKMIHLSRKEACEAACSSAKEVATEIGCTICCCRCCVRLYQLSPTSPVK